MKKPRKRVTKAQARRRLASIPRRHGQNVWLWPDSAYELWVRLYPVAYPAK